MVLPMVSELFHDIKGNSKDDDEDKGKNKDDDDVGGGEDEDEEGGGKVVYVVYSRQCLSII